MTDESILAAFFEECDDLIAALTEGLGEMLAGNSDSETVNAVFRSVHSIKGAAGAFGLDALVGFAHTFETVLDAVRSGDLAIAPELLHLLQRAGDILSDLVDGAQQGVTVPDEKVAPVRDALNAALGTDPAAADTDEDFVFEAMALDLPDATGEGPVFSVRFKPTTAFYAAGHDPVLLLTALAALGPCETKATMDDQIADLDGFDWMNGVIRWDVLVHGQATDLAIYEIFEFVEGLCDVEIREVAQTDDLQAEPAPLPVEENLEMPKSDKGEAPANRPVAKDAEARTKRPQTSLRVDPERVDRLINAVGELIINQSVIAQRIAETQLPQSSDLHTDLDDYKLLAREIQEGVMAIRAQPVKPLFQRMMRIAREAAEATGKSIVLSTQGEMTEVDKIVVERLADPLTHMVRNAIDHGIEDPKARKEAGKPEAGQLKLVAGQRSGSIVIEIIDDGAGLDRPRILNKAIENGLVARGSHLSDQEIDHLLFAPGFSTAEAVTNLSGRGVGMDVVKTAITALGGRIAISSAPGKGTVFAITLPLTLAVMDGMVIRVRGQTMVVPISSVIETIRPKAADLDWLDVYTEVVRVRGDYVPIVDLADRLELARLPGQSSDRVLLLIQTDTAPAYALAVDAIFDQRQVVVKSLEGHYGDIHGVSGATILGDGKIALIVDPLAVARPKVGFSASNSPRTKVAHYV